MSSDLVVHDETVHVFYHLFAIEDVESGLEELDHFLDISIPFAEYMVTARGCVKFECTSQDAELRILVVSGPAVEQEIDTLDGRGWRLLGNQTNRLTTGAVRVCDLSGFRSPDLQIGPRGLYEISYFHRFAGSGGDDESEEELLVAMSLLEEEQFDDTLYA